MLLQTCSLVFLRCAIDDDRAKVDVNVYGVCNVDVCPAVRVSVKCNTNCSFIVKVYASVNCNVSVNFLMARVCQRYSVVLVFISGS